MRTCTTNRHSGGSGRISPVCATDAREAETVPAMPADGIWRVPRHGVRVRGLSGGRAGTGHPYPAPAPAAHGKLGRRVLPRSLNEEISMTMDMPLDENLETLDPLMKNREVRLMAIPPRGFDMPAQEGFTLPRVRVFQTSSLEVKGLGREPGSLINSMTGERLLSDTFIPILAIREYLKFRPVDQGGTLEYRTRQRPDVLGKDVPHICYHFVSVIGADFKFPLIVSFAGLSFTAGMKFFA